MKNKPLYNFLITKIVLILLFSCSSAGDSGSTGGGDGGGALSDPIADASASTDFVYLGDSIDLDGSGSADPDGSIASWSWDMGNGTTIHGESQSYTYPAAGSYTITLTVTDNDENTNSVTVAVTVSDGSPTAEIHGSYGPILAGEFVTFSGSGTDPNGTIDNYAWSFGDGESDFGADLSSPSHTYADPSTPGSYTVSLTVTDNDGNEDSDTATIRVHQAPVADAGGNRSAEEGDDITFDGSGSTDPDADSSIQLYEWDFDYDGATFNQDASGSTVTHSWSAAGTYTVALQVTDNDGATDTDTVSVTIVEAGENQPPTADVGGPYGPVLVDTEVIFDGSASIDPDGTIESRSWDFDYDGSNHTEDATGVGPSHTYGSIGDYTIHLVVTDNDNATGTDTTTIRVHQIPTADINDTGNPATLLVGEEFTLNASDSQPDGGEAGGPVDSIAEYRWDFNNDGTVDSTTSVPEVNHSYNTEGTKTLSLTVLDSSGELSNSPDTYTLTVHEVVVADIGGPYFGSGAGNVNVFQLGDSIALDASASNDPDSVGSDTIPSFEWDFNYNGVPANLDADAVGATQSFDVSTVPINNTPGTYTMALRVTDPDDVTVTDIDTLTYKLNAPPAAEFSFSPSAQYTVGANTYDVLTGEVVTFNASGSADSDGALAATGAYEWDFGDGTASVPVDNNGTTYSYASAGEYTVTLTVTDDDGAQSSTSGMVIVAEEEQITIEIQ